MYKVFKSPTWQDKCSFLIKKYWRTHQLERYIWKALSYPNDNDLKHKAKSILQWLQKKKKKEVAITSFIHQRSSSAGSKLVSDLAPVRLPAVKKELNQSQESWCYAGHTTLQGYMQELIMSVKIVFALSFIDFQI